MMDPDDETRAVTYVIPARTLSGSVPRLLAEIDDMVEGLQIVREAVLARAPKAARRPWHARLRNALDIFQGRSREKRSRSSRTAPESVLGQVGTRR